MRGRTRTATRMLGLALLGVSMAILALQTGCPPPTPPSAPSVSVTVNPTSGNPPLAVLATATPSGGTPPYTFQWSSAPGGLIGAPTAESTNVSFVIPGTYTVTCLVTDSKSQTGTGSAQVTVGSTTPTVTPTLFISNVTGKVLSYKNPSTVNGNIAPDTNLSGGNTQLNQNFFVVVDGANELIAANSLGAGAASLTEYNDAPAANGNLAPNRNVTGINTQLAFPRGLAYDKTRDILYVANAGLNTILVFPNASTSAFNGNLAPTRTFVGGLANPQGISLDQNGTNLYVANQAANNITVYANPSTLNGTVTPTRTITGNPAFTGLFDVFVDGPNDRLYAVNAAAPQRVNMFLNASTRNGTQPPDTTLTIPGAVAIIAIAVDSGDHGYISDITGNSIFSYDNISTRNGTVTPDRTITGANTQLAAPVGLFILQ